MPERSYRLNITLSAYEMRQLIKWAKAHGRSRTAFAGQIIGARIEANRDIINAQIADMAAFEGLPVEEFERRLLEEENYFGDGKGDE